MANQSRTPGIDLIVKMAKDFVIDKLDEIADFTIEKLDDTVTPQKPTKTRAEVIDSVLMAHALADTNLSNATDRVLLRDAIIKALDADVSWSDMTDSP